MSDAGRPPRRRPTVVTAGLTVACALLCWPGPRPGRRLRTLTGRTTRRLPVLRPSPLLVIGGAAVLALLGFGAGVAIAVAAVGVTVRALWRSHRRTVGQLAAAESMVDAVHGVVAELRSGAHPVVAAESAARDARAPADAVLTAIAATARLGGDLTASLHRVGTPVLAPVLRPLVQAWSLAQRHGLPLADVLDAVRRDVAERLKFARRVRARMAGPKASGTVLAVLPLLGVLLGEGMGARPSHVLLATPVGQTLLAVGTSLICAGLYWITRLTTRTVLA
ncbi:MAG TPA: type II secretion system F family protein [Pseudonocardiaceae bacterium]|nr:type II secretion system F family protein [Pseudonocardiaceae bacterium]